MDEFMRAAREEAEQELREGDARLSSARTFSPTPHTTASAAVHMRLILPLLIACLAVAAPAAAQSSAERMRACDPGEPGYPLVGTVRDADTGEPLRFAAIDVQGEDPDWTGEDGCFAVASMEGSGPRRVQVALRRYLPLDTVVQISGRGDTLHLAMRPAPPGCCRLEGEWTLRLTLDTVPEGNRLKPRARETEGRIVFSERLPSGYDEEHEDPRVEYGRFDVDLAPFFGGPFARDVSTTTMGAPSEDFFTRAGGEVFAHDSVAMVLIPGMSHGGLSLEGTVRGDTARGHWIQNAYCCGARGRFVMHRVPPSPAGDSLVARGVRRMAAEREAAEQAKAARAGRVGRLRLRVWDTGAGRYTEVRFAAEGHEDNPGGGSTSLAYESGADGWGRVHELEPGRYDLLIYQFTCNGEERMGEWVDVNERTPRFPVTIESGRQVDKDIRLDVCAIEPDEGGEGRSAAPVAVPVP